MNTPTGDRIKVPGEMIGGNSAALLRRNSQDLARQDGRAEARNSDRERALRELTERDGNRAQEVPPGADGLVTWDVSPDQAGHLTRDVPAEDEADDSAQEAEEGRGEAEQDIRRAVNAETHRRHEPPSPG